jgi:hypothetical protein
LRKKKKGIYASKMKCATHMLFFRRHQKPGVKGWELQRALGADYPKVLEVLNDYLKSLDLQVKTVYEEKKTPTGKPTLEELNRARFYVTLRGELTPKESKMIGWRIDDLAGLAVAISYIISKKGQAPRKSVEEVLSEKLPSWKVDINIDRYIRYGYLQEDENNQLYLNWRTHAEVDEKALIDLLLRSEVQTAMPSEVTDGEKGEANEEDSKQ